MAENRPPAAGGRRQAINPAPVSVSRVLLKALLLFVVFNLLFAFADPLAGLGRISAYNTFFPGRARLPYGDNPERAYNVSVLNLEALFAAHEIAAGTKPPGEFRVLLIGDSSTWGWLLKPADTLAAQLNRAQLKAGDGRAVRVYNLGYPIMSLAKDVLIIDRAMQYQPDAIVWLMTLESFPADKQLFHPLLQFNPAPTRRLIERYGLKLDPNDTKFATPSFWERTLVGRQRDLADLLRLQLYGVMWAATSIDQDYPAQYEPAAVDLEDDVTFHDLQPPALGATDLPLGCISDQGHNSTFPQVAGAGRGLSQQPAGGFAPLGKCALFIDALDAGARAIGAVPLLIVNEPMLISAGANSDVRYNFFYPRWAYDQYRALLAAKAAAQGWNYLDLWNLLPPNEFTNSAVHYTPAGAKLLADQLAMRIAQLSKISAP